MDKEGLFKKIISSTGIDISDSKINKTICRNACLYIEDHWCHLFGHKLWSLDDKCKRCDECIKYFD